MKNILIALLIIAAAVSCSKKEDEPEPPKELVTFNFDTTAPFPVPIIDWTKGPEYIKANIPPKYHPISPDKAKMTIDIGPVSFTSYRGVLFISDDDNGDSITYHFDKDDKLMGIVVVNSEKRNYPVYVAYFEKKLGKPDIYSRGKMWETKNVNISMSNEVWEDIDVVLLNPLKFEKW